MKLASFDRWVIVLLAVLGVGLAGLWVYTNLSGLKPPQPAAEQVGARGPVGLIFGQKMQIESVESRWRSQPALTGRFGWEGQTLWFWPEVAMDPAIRYRFTLAAGAQAVDGQSLHEEINWVIQVREPMIIYQSIQDGGSELWRITQNGSQSLRLTQTNGRVYDYGVALDGERLVYSVKNDQQGSDLWQVRRDGSDARMVVNCGGDSCIQPAWSADGQWIAYSRRRLSVVQGEAYSPLPRIWTFEMATEKTAPLFQEATISGTNPTWSPDGKRLAFFEAGAHAIHVLNIETGKELMLASQLGVVGTWTGNGSQLWYGDLETSETLPFGSAYMADLVQERVQPLFTQLPDPEDFALPAPTPDGKWVAVGVRVRGGSHSVQLQIMRPDGTERASITQDFLFSHGAYSWDSGGQTLLYQRVQTATSTPRPEIWVWSLADRQAKFVAVDGARPAWLP